MALFPTVVMYSALPLREVYLVCLVMFGLVWVARWSREGKVRQAIWAFVLFGVAIFFHGSAFLIAFGFMVVIAIKIFWRGGQSFIRGRLHLTALVGLVVVGGSILFWGLSGIKIDKIGSFDEAIQLERWVSYSQAKYYAGGREANAVYPEWTAPKSISPVSN
jgi:hypothetical protein